MSTVALDRDFDLRRARAVPRCTPARARHGFFRRILRRMLAAVERSDRRLAEQEAGRFIAARGGRLTDDVERQLTEHFNGRGFPPYVAPRSFRRFMDF